MVDAEEFRLGLIYNLNALYAIGKSMRLVKIIRILNGKIEAVLHKNLLRQANKRKNKLQKPHKAKTDWGVRCPRSSYKNWIIIYFYNN